MSMDCHHGSRVFARGDGAGNFEFQGVVRQRKKEGGSDERDNIFSSRLRDLERNDITNVWRFTREFLVDQDAFDPGIDFAYFLGYWRDDVPAGDRHRIVNPGFTLMMADGSLLVSIPPIERIDYLALGT